MSALSIAGRVSKLTNSDWSRKAFEQRVMTDLEDQSYITRLLAQSSASTIERNGRFAMHLFASSGNAPLLSIVRQCLEQSSGVNADYLRQYVFEQPAFKKSILPGSSVPTEVIDPLIDTLRTAKDGVLAVTFAHDLVEILKGDKKGKNYDTVSCPDVMSVTCLIRRSFPSFTRGPDSLASRRRKRQSRSLSRISSVCRILHPVSAKRSRA